MSKTKKVLLFFLFFAVVSGVIEGINKGPQKTKAPPTAEEIAAKEKEEREFLHVLRVVKSIKAAQKNPDSFKLELVLVMDDATVCVSYRGTNSFNAVVSGRAVAKKEAISTSDADWNRYCGGKKGRDFDKVRYAL